MDIFREYRHLVIASLICLLLGYVLFRTPGVKRVTFPDGSGYVTVPRSMEGWKFRPGSDPVLLRGQTRLRLNQLEVTRTGATDQQQLKAYITDRHERLFGIYDDYLAQLNGETRRFGLSPAPISRAMFRDRWPLFGFPTQMIEHNAYWLHHGEYLRFSLRYPRMIEKFVAMDQYILAAGLEELRKEAGR